MGLNPVQAWLFLSWPVCDRGYFIWKILVVFVVFFMWWLNCCNFLNFTSGCCYRHTGRWQAETRGIGSSWIGCCSHWFFSRKFNLPVRPNQVNNFVSLTVGKEKPFISRFKSQICRVIHFIGLPQCYYNYLLFLSFDSDSSGQIL